jgi:DNA-binding PadR family transcriptional regulator
MERPMSTADPRSLLPLSTAAFYILVALAGGDRHGYSITKEVEAATSGAVRLGAGTLYRIIREMLADGWIREVGERGESNDPVSRRRYYSLAPWGRRIAEAEAQRLNDVLSVARSRRLLPA